MNPLSLYRQLLRYGQSLRFTDQQYFSQRIRQEFEKGRHLKDAADIEHAVKKGQELLRKSRLV